jgi:hypothetical protein
MTTPGSFYDHAMTGYDDGSPGETPSLAEASHLWSSAATGGYKPTSVLGQYRLSANGSSEKDAQRQLPDGSYLPTGNSTSQGTNEASTPLRLIGNIQ